MPTGLEAHLSTTKIVKLLDNNYIMDEVHDNVYQSSIGFPETICNS